VSDQPTIGRIVHYRTDGRNGLIYDLPAIVTCTRDSHPGDYPAALPGDHPDARRNPLPVPDEGCVHLTVFTPGGFGTKVATLHTPTATDADYVDAQKLTPGSGTYVEWNVPENRMDGGNAEPRTWRWPERP